MQHCTPSARAELRAALPARLTKASFSRLEDLHMHDQPEAAQAESGKKTRKGKIAWIRIWDGGREVRSRFQGWAGELLPARPVQASAAHHNN